MPRYCKVKAKEFSSNEFLARGYQSGCEFIIPWLGIDPGSDDTDWLELIMHIAQIIFDPNTCWFQITILFITTGVAFMLGVYVRRRTIIGLLRQKEEWIDKEKMLLNQLWAALEEKLENKSMLHEARTALDKVKGCLMHIGKDVITSIASKAEIVNSKMKQIRKTSRPAVELDGERSEKESMQSRMWGMERNVKILQSERDVLEEKLRDCVGTFSGLRKSIAKGVAQGGQGESAEVSNCMEKIKGLQSLMQKLIEAHRQEHVNFVSLLEKQPGV